MKKIIIVLNLYLMFFCLISCGDSDVKHYKNEVSKTEFKLKFDECYDDAFWKTDILNKDFTLSITNDQTTTDYLAGDVFEVRSYDYNYNLEYDSNSGRCNLTEISIKNGKEEVNQLTKMKVYDNAVYLIFEDGGLNFKKYNDAEYFFNSRCSFENEFISFYNTSNIASTNTKYYVDGNVFTMVQTWKYGYKITGKEEFILQFVFNENSLEYTYVKDSDQYPDSIDEYDNRKEHIIKKYALLFEDVKL